MMLKKLKKINKIVKENSLKKKALELGYFDHNYYLECYPDVKKSALSPAEHYYKLGWKEGRNPSEKFNTAFYLKSNEDVKQEGINPLFHYILNGKNEGREALPKISIIEEQSNLAIPILMPIEIMTEEPKSPLFHLLKKSHYFSERYYKEHYPDVWGCPIEHYIHYGWKEGRNPSHEFNTNYYLEKNLDVAASGINPLEHFIKYGKSEGRKARIKLIKFKKEEKQHSPAILFISHEASETGAPAVLLSLMKWLKDNTTINFSIIVGASGPWNNKFEAIAPTFFFDRPHTEQDIKNFCGDHVQTVYINTIAAASYAKAFEFLHAEFITHVHEMESVFKIFEHELSLLKGMCNKYIAVSPGSIDAINKRFDNIELQYLKPFINHYIPLEETVHPCSDKKIIFGCGAVEKRKGFDLFCQVADQLNQKNITNVEMHWIGSDAFKDLNAAQTIQEFNVENLVKFIGPKANPRDYFRHGDLFLLTSREDPYPLVCMEAAEMNMPVICFDSEAGGMHTFVEEDAGIVVPYLDTLKMANAVISLIKNKKLSKKMGGIAKQKVAERHYVDVIAPQILDFMPKAATVGQTEKIANYKALIDQAKIVSFDIFDTLVTREMAQPEVVFDIAEFQHTANEAGILSLFQERMKTAGKVLGSKKGKVDDINIDEIYDHMPLYRDSKIEKQAEIATCIVHPIGKILYQHAISQGKQIYITSDMYLDRETIEKILKKNGYQKWNAFFLSSEMGKKKDTGKLFEEVKTVAMKTNVSANDILHVGDNWIGDIKFARKAGLNAVRFTPIYESDSKLIELSHDQKNNLSQMGRIWDSFSTQASRLWAQENTQLATDFYTSLGFELTGPLASMMAMHTKKIADEKGIKKIVFMARDGRIIKKAFDILYSADLETHKYESQYLHLSRATVVGATFESKLSSNDLYFLIEGLHLAEKDINYFLNKAKLNVKQKTVLSKVKKYFSSIDYVPNWNDFSKLSSMLESLSTEIYNANADHREGLEMYLREQGILNSDKVLVVDVGWLINIQSRLDRFIKTLNPKTQIIGAYVGTRERVNKSLEHVSLLYNLGEPSVYSRFLEANVTLFEVLFSSPEPSASAITVYEGKSQLTLKPLGSPLPKEYIVAQKLQMGAEAYFEKLAMAMHSHLPLTVSTDYFFSIFEALVKTPNEVAKVELGHFEVRLGGHHEFIAYQNLIPLEPNLDYKYEDDNEYFEPINYLVDDAKEYIVIVTSAGLNNGSTRYRALNLAESLQFKQTQSVVIHSQTPVNEAETLIKQADKIIFQRCFAEQGNVSSFLKIARKYKKNCLGEIDDLVFPEYIAEVGSVKGGEWDLKQAMFIAKSYENFMLELDSMIVSTPALKEYIESKYQIASQVIPNKISYSKIRKPLEKKGPLKLIYASGTYSHKEDFALIEKPLFDYLRENPKVKLSILGATQSSERILSLSNVSSYPLLPYDAMLDFIAKHDVMLVPLVDDVFNNAKSNVKFIEAGAVGVPVIASNVREFRDSIKDEINGYLCNDITSFRHKLNNFSRKKFIELRKEAFLVISKNFNTGM